MEETQVINQLEISGHSTFLAIAYGKKWIQDTPLHSLEYTIPPAFAKQAQLAE